MATKLKFHSIYTSVPGAYTYVDRAGMNPLSPLATGVVALLGEASGGGAGGGTALLTLNSPQDAMDAYQSGDLLEAALLCFNPSGDSRVGGARKIIAVKVNPATQAYRMMTNADGNALYLTSLDYGIFANRINVEKAMSGVAPADTCDFTAVLDSLAELYQDIGGTAWFSLLYTSGSYTTMTASVTTDGLGDPNGLTCAATRVDAAGEATGVTFTAGDAAVVACNAVNNGHTVTIYGVNSDGAVASEAGLIAAAAYTSTAKWLRVTAATLSADVAVGNLTVADSHANVCLTIAFGVGNRSTGRKVLTSCPVANRPIGLVSNGATTDPVVLRGLDAAGAVQNEAVALTGAVATYSKGTWSQLDSIEIGGVPAGRTLTLSTTAGAVRTSSTNVASTTVGHTGTEVAEFTDGDRVTVTSGVAAAGRIVTVYGLDASSQYQTEVLPALSATGTATGTSVWTVVFYATADDYPGANVLIKDEHTNTVQTIESLRKTSGILSPHTAGFYPLNLPHSPSATVSVVADGATTRRVLLVGLDDAGATQRELITLTGAVSVNSAETWSRIDGIYLGDVEAARTVTLTWGYEITGGHTTISNLVDAFNSVDGFTATATGDATDTDLISELDIPTVATYGAAQPLNIYNLTKSWYGKLTELIRKINDKSTIIAATRPAGATGLPTNTAAPVYLTGGTEGTTTNSHWIAAFNKLLTTDEPETVCPLSDSAAIHALADAHALQCEGVLRRERDVKVGLPSGSTKAAIKTLTQAINSRRVQAVAQDVDRYDSDGVLYKFPPYFFAAMAGGMEAGAEGGLPLTRKWINAMGVHQDSSWDPILDADEMIDAGLLFAEEVAGQGFRWVRGVTTWLKDSNIANCEASVNQSLNRFVRFAREQLEALVGDINFAGTTAAVQSLWAATCRRAVQDGYITNYGEPSFVQTGDELRIDCEVIPPVPLNFIPINVHAVLTLS